MYPLLKPLHATRSTSLHRYSNLIDLSLSFGAFSFASTIHAQLIKFGLNVDTFLGNRCLEMYVHFGPIGDAWKAFEDISEKNTISRNILLTGLLRFDHIERACILFDEMPQRDVVSWNSMICGLKSRGFNEYALSIFMEMQIAGFRPSGYTYSGLISIARCTHQGKEIHGSIIRTGMILENIVLGNSLIDMYGGFGLIDYAFNVFYTMKDVDIITWNSLILSCHKSGLEELALDQFCLMRSTEHSPDQFTFSMVINVCSCLQNLGMGKQIFVFCFKLGCSYNSIILSATIDMFSKCNSLVDAVRLFDELNKRDLAICNSMISSYAQHGFGHDGLRIFVSALRENLRPSEFTLSSVLGCVSVFMPTELCMQIHSLVVKSGFEYDSIVASSLVNIYAKFGLIESAIDLFKNMEVKDLISWNTFLMGLTINGVEYEVVQIFKEAAGKGLPADSITLAVVLLACNYGGFVDEGLTIFSAMEKDYGIVPANEHYACIVNLLGRAGKLVEAMDIISKMPYLPSLTIWKSLLCACTVDGDLAIIEKVAEKIMEMDPRSDLPHVVLARAYQARGMWETMIRAINAVRHKSSEKSSGCSWVGMKNFVCVFKDSQLQYYPGEMDMDLASVLRLLVWETEEEDDQDNARNDFSCIRIRRNSNSSGAGRPHVQY